MMRIAVFPGSFDPISKGHEDIINRASMLFDKIIIAVGINSEKNALFSLEKRMHWIKKTFEKNSKIEIATYAGLTINFCEKVGARYIIRGIRNSVDFRYERDIAQTNRQLDPNIETVFLVTSPELANISSSVIRDIYLNKGDYKQFMPDNID